MPNLRASEHYIWCDNDVLGRGATGEVYKARNKETGEVYAVKTFNQYGVMRPVGVQKRELDVLCKLNHDNIVQMLALEEDVSTKTKVIVMELCTGGSLYGLLDLVQHYYGLQEDEFLTVLFDVAAGMQYLRSADIVHRDIKPGNIMKCITEDGRSVYKLTDFGAARELVDDQPFMSLYGTEEYLHPDLYERAVMNICTGKKFQATVDLWSVGVTLFHTATGQLPFRPFGGRKNREMMYKITQEKDSGVISGVQDSESDEIKWSRELPDTCRLSVSLKKQLTHMLASLLENDKDKMWSFDRFFDEVKKLKEKVHIYVFNVCTLNILKIYIDPGASLSNLHEMIADLTGLRAAQQMLLFENGQFTDVVSPLQRVSSYPVTAPDNPVFLFPKEVSGACSIREPAIADFPDMKVAVTLDSDASDSRQCCGVLHAIQQQIQTHHQCRRLLSIGCKLFMHVFGGEVRRVEDCVEHVDVLMSEMSRRVTSLNNMHLLCLNWCTVMQPGAVERCRNQTDIVKQVQAKSNELSYVVNELKQDVGRFTADRQRVLLIPSDEGLNEEKQRKGQIGILLTNVTEIMELFRKNRIHRRLNYNDEQIHKFEKMRLQSSCVTARSVYEHSSHQMEQLKQTVQDWLRTTLHSIARNKELDNHVTNLLTDLHKMSEELDQAEEDYKSKHTEHLTKIEQYKSETEAPVRPASRSSSTEKKKIMMKNLQADLASLTNDTVEIRKAMQENQQVLNTIKLMNEMDSATDDAGFEVLQKD